MKTQIWQLYQYRNSLQSNIYYCCLLIIIKSSINLNFIFTPTWIQQNWCYCGCQDSKEHLFLIAISSNNNKNLEKSTVPYCNKQTAKWYKRTFISSLLDLTAKKPCCPKWVLITVRCKWCITAATNLEKSLARNSEGQKEPQALHWFFCYYLT